MKLLFILATILVPALAGAAAGPRVGNGGGAWVCQEPGGDYRWIELVDLFEAEREYGLTLSAPAGSDPWDALRDRFAFVQSRVPSLARALTTDPERMRASVQILPKFTELTRIDDDQVRVKPSPASCAGGTLFYGQLANYTYDGRLLIAGDLWSSPALPDQSRAALLMHEIVYKSLRDRDGDENSSRARAIVGLLFSAGDASAIDLAVGRLLAEPELGRAPPPPRALPLACFAHIESESATIVPGPAARLLPDPSGALTARIERFTFRVEDNADSVPTELRITDQKTGISTTSAPGSAADSFRKNGRVTLSLELSGEQRIVSLECRAIAP